MLFWFITKKYKLQRCPLKYRPFYDRMFFDKIFVLLNLPEHLKRLQSYLISKI